MKDKTLKNHLALLFLFGSLGLLRESLRDGVVLLNEGVDMLLEGGHLTYDILDNLGRQFLQDLVLRTPQDKRLDPLLQTLQGIDETLGLLELFGQLLDVRGKILIVLLVKDIFLL